MSSTTAPRPPTVAHVLLSLQERDLASADVSGAARGDLTAQVPKDWLKLYETLRTRTRPPWVFLVDGGACPRCFVMLPTAVHDRFKRECVVACLQCNRLLVSIDLARQPAP